MTRLTKATIRGPRRVDRTPPVNIDQADHRVFEHEYSKTLPAFSVYRGRRVYIYRGMLFGPLRCYPRFYHLGSNQRKLALKKRIRLILRHVVDLSDGIWITDNHSGNYFHWITDSLTKLMAGRYRSKTVLLPEGLRRISYVQQSLELLGFTPTYLDDHSVYRVTRLELPSRTAPTGNYDPDILRQLRRQLSEHTISGDDQKKIYVSRSGAARRQLKNEHEICQVLERRGFETVSFEDLSLTQQIRLASRCRVLIGLHGAGLTNMLFLPPGAHVIEIRMRGDRHNNCYFSMASALGLHYWYAFAEPDQQETLYANSILESEVLDDLLNAVERARASMQGP